MASLNLSLFFICSSFLLLIILEPVTVESKHKGKAIDGPLTNVTKQFSFSDFHPIKNPTILNDVKLLGSARFSVNTSSIQIPDTTLSFDPLFAYSPIRLFDPLTETPASFKTAFSFQFKNTSSSSFNASASPMHQKLLSLKPISSSLVKVAEILFKSFIELNPKSRRKRRFEVRVLMAMNEGFDGDPGGGLGFSHLLESSNGEELGFDLGGGGSDESFMYSSSFPSLKPSTMLCFSNVCRKSASDHSSSVCSSNNSSCTNSNLIINNNNKSKRRSHDGGGGEVMKTEDDERRNGSLFLVENDGDQRGREKCILGGATVFLVENSAKTIEGIVVI